MAFARKTFLDRIEDEGYTMDIIVGNHDTYYKTTNDVNSVKELAGKYDQIQLYEEPTIVERIGGSSSGGIYIPWITPATEERAFKLCQAEPNTNIFGHLELRGFSLRQGYISETGYDQQTMAGNRRIFTGHYHQRSSKDNVFYIGAPYEMTWTDAGQDRGFSIYDTDKQDVVRFCRNPFTLFEKIAVTDGVLPTVDVSGKYVSIDISSGSRPAGFNDWLAAIEDQSPINIKITEALTTMSDDDIDVDVRDTEQVIKDEIAALETHVDKASLEKMMINIHNTAIETMSEIS